jgi:hypothetical protein
MAEFVANLFEVTTHIVQGCAGGPNLLCRFGIGEGVGHALSARRGLHRAQRIHDVAEQDGQPVDHDALPFQ